MKVTNELRSVFQGKHYFSIRYKGMRRNEFSQSRIATDGQSVCLSWCRAPAGAQDQMFLLA
jgi:hypothetical protein